uniref:CNNM transmembrane domain-containing protein n=2 Tax=Caenorhabditis tropicalis TaxID=1561998 RepID=A0A1I7U3P3_9PELO
MLEVQSLDGLELLIFAGFLEWYYMYSVIFGVLAIASERLIASVLIENYESNTQLFIPTILTLTYQFLSILVSLAVLFHKIEGTTTHILWSISCLISAVVYLFVRRINKSFHREIKNMKRNRVFTISQQFQVKENLRALDLGTNLVFVVLATIAVCGSGILALNFELIPPFYAHFVENSLFLNPYLICFTAMLSVPQWKKKFLKMFITFRIGKMRRRRRITQMESIDIIDNSSRKNLEIETNLYFKQLTESWI